MQSSGYILGHFFSFGAFFAEWFSHTEWGTASRHTENNSFPETSATFVKMSVTMIPSRYLTFQGTLEDKMTSYLNLQNSSGKHLAFKILTNAPKGKIFLGKTKIGVGKVNLIISISLLLQWAKFDLKRCAWNSLCAWHFSIGPVRPKLRLVAKDCWPSCGLTLLLFTP